MRRFAIVVALLTVAWVVSAAPANPATATPDDSLYQTVRRLALIAGESPPSAVSPVSYGELEAVLRRLDVEALTAVQQDQYRAALEKAAAGASQIPRGTVGVQSTLEGYFHSAEDPDEWLYWYPDRRPLLSIPIRVTPVAGLAISVDLDWRQNYPMFPGYPTYETTNPDPLTNVFSDLRETDVQFPFHALLSAAGSGWSVQYGRSRIGWGLGHTGSLLLSDHVDYHDFLMASVFGRLMSYRSLYLDLEPWRDASGTTDPDRVYLAHRIELRPLPWLTLTANEAMILHGKPIELRYLNPLMILHSWFLFINGNSMIDLEVSARPFKGLEVWAHLAIDQLQSAIEKDRGYTDREPEALGYLAGAEYVLPLNRAWLSVGTECVYLNPWMYIGRAMLGSFTYRRRVQAEHVLPSGRKVIVEKPLGYPAGPDYCGITTFAELDVAARYRVSLDVTLFAKGENDVGRILPPIDETDALRVTPSGAASEYGAATRLSADGTIFEAEFRGVPIELTVGATLDVLRLQNNDHVSGALLWDVQFSPYLSVSTVFGD